MYEMEKVFNGDWNDDIANTGGWNAGSANTGNRNYGSRNTGDYNAGIYNSGSHNNGDWNTGDYNIGNYNTGSYNNGDWNTGDWNASDCCNGCFNTNSDSQTIFMFNKPACWTLYDWLESDARYYLNQIRKWVLLSDITNEEKKQHPEYKATNGYLKRELDSQIWWDNSPDYVKESIKSLPNFDADIFWRYTGIKVD